MSHYIKFRHVLLLLALVPLLATAIQEWKHGGVTILYEMLPDGTARVTKVDNQSDGWIIPLVDNQDLKQIQKGKSASFDVIAKIKIGYRSSEVNTAGFNLPVSKPAEPAKSPAVPADPNTEQFDWTQSTPAAPVADDTRTKPAERPVSDSRRGVQPRSGDLNFLDRLEEHPMLSRSALTDFKARVDGYISSLSSATDPQKYIADNGIDDFLATAAVENESLRDQIPVIAREMTAALGMDSSAAQGIESSIVEITNARLGERVDACGRLQALVDGAVVADDESSASGNILNYAVVGAIVLAVVVLVFIVYRRKKKKTSVEPEPHTQSSNDPDQAIVVRRRTTSILKRQCLDDVVSNPQYLRISVPEYMQDSAVRYIYIKNTCIKDIYNMYAEDLRNSDRPNEDGCMVLGRWVYDESTQTYDVSLEFVVYPDDDAVFKEYELNFGGKIRLRIAEKLRKLRRDTGLQYDLTCWIHSHPGMGVFFSNFDSNVQMQLKHPQHPNFLVAFVIDILTSDQELGIFTFRNDGTVNSKNDMLKMHSLEDMYKWALESDKVSFAPENHYNLLRDAKSRAKSCHGVELNNSAVIDLARIGVEAETGVVAWAVGYTVDTAKGVEYVVSAIEKGSERPGTGAIGAMVCVSYMSLPTIQRMTAQWEKNIGFVMVYSSKQSTVTTIPVLDGTLATDESYYGEANIDDLKIWTRRKR